MENDEITVLASTSNIDSFPEPMPLEIDIEITNPLVGDSACVENETSDTISNLQDHDSLSLTDNSDLEDIDSVKQN